MAEVWTLYTLSVAAFQQMFGLSWLTLACHVKDSVQQTPQDTGRQRLRGRWWHNPPLECLAVFFFRFPAKHTVPTSGDLKTQEKGWVFVALQFKDRPHVWRASGNRTASQWEEGSRPSVSLWAWEGRLAWVTYWFLSPFKKVVINSSQGNWTPEPH